MLLAIDIGNSNVTFGLFQSDRWLGIWRLPTRSDREALLFYETRLSDWLLESGVRPEQLKQAVISSVVPELAPLFRKLIQHLLHLDPLLVEPDIYPQLELRIDRPEELGADLFANAVAAHRVLQRDCIIVDFGTALTFTTLTGQGHVLGVAIAPGLKTSIQALSSSTAKLPEVPLELPSTPIGRNTVHAIQSGVLNGYVGLVRHLLFLTREEVGHHYQAVATGGLSSILHPLESSFHLVDPNLTLNGLRIIGEEVKAV